MIKPNPSYPRYIESDLVMRRLLAEAGHKYSAELVDEFYNPIATGPWCENESKAIEALANNVADKSRKLNKRADELRKL